jgi:hypothetical protein
MAYRSYFYSVENGTSCCQQFNMIENDGLSVLSASESTTFYLFVGIWKLIPTSDGLLVLFEFLQRS